MKKITLIYYCLSAFFFLAQAPNLYAQLQNANWYFGNQAGINFNDGTAPATLLTDGAMNALAGCTSVSNDFGDLLFYTNGVTVWNKNHVPMSNGNLMGDVNVSQSVVVIPNPANVDQYFIFLNSAENQAHSGLRYSVVDMTLASGLGDVDLNTQDVVLLTNCSEKMTAINNPYDNTYWLVSFGPSSDPVVYDTFYTFKIDENGDVNAPVVSNFSSDAVLSIPFQTTEFAYAPHAGGQMKISPDFNTLALVHNLDDRGASAKSVFIFDFSPITGELASDSIRSYYLNDLFNQSNMYYYGLEFSPDSQQIFVSTIVKDGNGFGEVIRMRNFAQGETPNYYLMGVPVGRDPVFALQLGIDGKIYATRGDMSFLDVITNPDEQGEIEINYSYGGFMGEGFDLGSIIAGQGLPQLVPYDYLPGSKPSTTKKYSIIGNPFQDNLNIKFHTKERYTTQLYDMFGKQVKSETYDITSDDVKKAIRTGNLSSGIYRLIITDMENTEYNIPVVKI